jgi:metalloendopeptidase OMA1, mitochondrial
MRGRCHYGLWMLAACVAAQACATDPIVQTPAMIRILTKESAASETGPSASAPLVSDVRILEPAVRVASRLIAAARRSDYGSRARALCWVIAVYNTPTVSRSFVRSDGGIAVSTGTFRLAQTESGLAAILSHELIHALAHDETPVSPVCVRTTGQPPALFTREEESKTDDMGLTLMADAGYDPRELLGLWERMKREHDGTRDEVLLHFTYDRRMEQIAQLLPQALRRYEHANRAPQKVLPMD